jgi:hypothetical protein
VSVLVALAVGDCTVLFKVVYPGMFRPDPPAASVPPIKGTDREDFDLRAPMALARKFLMDELDRLSPTVRLLAVSFGNGGGGGGGGGGSLGSGILGAPIHIVSVSP